MTITMRAECVFFILCFVSNTRGQNTIIDVAKNLGANTLISLIKDAGLTETLESDGPFTVFAPTDDAFSKVPSDVINNLKNNKTLLTEVLKYHVVSGKVLSSDLSNDMTVPSLLDNQDVRINVYESRFILKIVTVNGCTVIKPDQEASNGIIHVIDRVIYPIPSENMIEYITNRPNLQTLAKGFSSAGIEDIFEEGGPFTLFAPTDEAFQKLPEKTRNLLQTNITYLKEDSQSSK
ncbi:hypothetical protein KUTeg_020467 [Tegillarca granosa]|uniref:FAS1 domain-containing protein n=1 Tax=Tegillarca granosa TaxID=220873 RepID=A0ABQ9ED95_TEGGR|nr:hypothetical protein KUTeg_020467 [Tegillarca granosa]